MDNPYSTKVSIIVPVFNGEYLIHRTIMSILNQTYPNWELIIIDDGSTDNTITVVNEYVKRDERIKLYRRDRDPKSASTCRNIGAEKSTGEYLIFLDSDDELKDYCLEQRVEVMSSDPVLTIAVFKMMLKYNDGKEQEQKINESTDYLIDFLSYNMPWQTMCPIWKKKFFFEVGCFDENYVRHQDPELFIRALLHENIKLKVCNNYKYDSLYYLNIQHAPRQYAAKNYYLTVYKGSSRFVNEITSLLKDKGLKDQIPLLKSYLYYYLNVVIFDFQNYFDRERYTISKDLINQYSECGVITRKKKKKLLFFLLSYFQVRRIAFKAVITILRFYEKNK